MIHQAKDPAFPKTLLVMRSASAARHASQKYTHWDICSPETVLTGRRYDRVLVHEETVEYMQYHWTWEKTHRFLGEHLSTRLCPGGELKQLSRIDTIIDLC